MLTAAALGLSRIAEGGSWTAAASGFPAGDPVAFSLHFGFDLQARTSAPSLLPIWVNVNGEAAFSLGDVYDSFPVWANYQSQARADEGGSLRLTLDLLECRLSVPSTCTIDGSSTLTATLVNTKPWLEAPPCTK